MRLFNIKSSAYIIHIFDCLLSSWREKMADINTWSKRGTQKIFAEGWLNK